MGFNKSSSELSTADDQYLLFQLYQADGNWSKAEGQLKSLLASHRENPLFLAQYIFSCSVKGSTDEAESWFEKLEKLEPKSLRTLELKGVSRRPRSSQRGRPASHVRGGTECGQVGYVARLLEELGQECRGRGTDAEVRLPGPGSPERAWYWQLLGAPESPLPRH